MSLNINGTEFLTAKEAAHEIGFKIQTFHNKRTALGDRFINGHPLLPGRVFFKHDDVMRVARERS